MLETVPTVYMSDCSGCSTEMSFCPTRNTGLPAFMASSSALMDISRATSKWIITLGNTVSPRRAMVGMVETSARFHSLLIALHFLS